MRTLKLSILSLGLVAGFSSTASAQLKFDDAITTPIDMVSSYGGYNFSNTFAINSLGYWGTAASAGGYYTAMKSGNYVMSNAGASPLGVSRSSAFDFKGGYFAATWTNGLSLNARGYNNGVQVYNKNFQLSWSQAAYLNLDMYNVDNVIFTNSGGTVDPSFNPGSNNGFAFDDLDIASSSQRISSVGTDTVVPEPMTMSLVGFGLLAVGGVSARRRRATAK